MTTGEKNLFFLLFVVRKHVQNDVDCDRRGSGHLNHKKIYIVKIIKLLKKKKGIEPLRQTKISLGHPWKIFFWACKRSRHCVN